ncbi:hypothetical protein [Thiolinea disciformis]|uniref:hypothetical protein n=1 Tax=Thiolinea disciformis TaxID=125614 RepID=UPI0003762F41|nr:hypothetical protein [Thiolinea disciformis]
MKSVSKILGLFTAACVLSAAGQSFAESTYGYQGTGVGGVTATAKVQVTVTVPKLILLRVGTEGSTVDNLAFTAAGSVASAPTTLTTGNSLASTWGDSSGAVAPSFTNTAGQTLTAYAWTNASGGSLSCATVANTMFVATNGLTSADVKVSSTGTLAHPGTDTSCAGPATTLTKNTLATGTWTYSILGSALATAQAGEHKQTTTYTASAL